MCLYDFYALNTTIFFGGLPYPYHIVIGSFFVICKIKGRAGSGACYITLAEKKKREKRKTEFAFPGRSLTTVLFLLQTVIQGPVTV